MEAIIEKMKPGIKTIAKRKLSKNVKESRSQGLAHYTFKDGKTSKSVAAFKEKIAERF